jgi:hypothetical protein
VTQTQLSSHLREAVNKISPAADVHALAQRIPRYMASATPPPTLYHNYAVGECNDLIFGVSLVDYAQSRGLSEGQVPKIVKICVQEVDQRGLENEGIYRVRGTFVSYGCLQLLTGSSRRCLDDMRLYKR